jgi:hypothetical protein
MKDKQTERHTKARGLSFEELETQVGELLPNRIEMRRKKRRGHGSSSSVCNGGLGCVGINVGSSPSLPSLPSL